MLLRWIYYGVAILLAVPFVLWHAFVGIIMWDSNYWHNACYGVYKALEEDKQDFLSPNNKL